MVFPELNREPMIDSIIMRCWYGTVAELAADTEKLYGMSSEASRGKIEGVKCSAPISADDFTSRRKLCEDLVRCGISKALSLRNPRQLGLPIKRRHVCWELLQELSEMPLFVTDEIWSRRGDSKHAAGNSGLCPIRCSAVRVRPSPGGARWVLMWSGAGPVRAWCQPASHLDSPTSSVTTI
ncbi:uncharacterized protein CIMG_11531 [Coccidioides immitis RS]|uniref:Uncharacterized protein n=1 Tax=Coccidioides immitis (strain RS) TaxID=246410 RepID=J3KFI0_COCIM|nr:uncharacterized protein CIMG_11531 [Coccidioides immitis RS]EAS34386.3 hypothetical protein CIMG_11531 [Coccidioides immitis RS]